MDTGKYGIKETSELMDGMEVAAVLVYKARKAALRPDGSIDFPLMGQNLAGTLMMDAPKQETLKLMFDNISEVPKECGDLGLAELAQLAQRAVQNVAKAAQEVSAP